MRKKWKPGIKRMMTLGSATFLVAAPVSLVVACDNGVTLIPAESVLINGKTASDLAALSKSSDTKAVSDVFVNQIKYELGEKLYNAEQSASANMQTIWFKWSKENARQAMIKAADEILAMDFASGRPTPEEVDTPEKKLAAIERLSASNFTEAYRDLFRSQKNTFDSNKNERTKIDNKLADIANNRLNYDVASFAVDYPRILRPLAKEREQQTKIYNERKATFIKNYKTEADGLKAWIEALPRSYGEAKTDDDAIKYLLDQAIAGKAFGQFQIHINSEFTVEMFNALDEQNERIFPWFAGTTLVKADETNPPTGTFFSKDPADKNAKVYFVSRQTNDASNFTIKVFDATTFGNWNASARPISVSHGLVAAKQTAGKAFDPWTITQESLTKMLQYYAAPDGSPVQSFSLFQTLFSDRPGVSHEENLNLDNSFIDFFSGDPSGRNKRGDLGVNSLSGYVKTMVPGFALGLVAAMSDRTDVTETPEEFGLVKNESVGQTMLTELQTRLHAVAQSEINIDGIGTPGTPNAVGQKNLAISQWVKSLTDDAIKRNFGTIFSSIFRNANLAYRMSGNDHNDATYLVVSEFGLHMIKVSDLSPGNSLENSLTSDLNAVALADDVAKAKTNWTDLFSKIYNDRFIIKSLINNSEEMKLFVDGLQQSKPDLYQKWVDDKYIRDVTTGVKEAVSVAALRMIASLESNTTIADAEAAIGDKITKFLTDGIKNRQLTSTIKPGIVNARAYSELGISNG